MYKTSNTTSPRGLRNNNPLNIIISPNKWLGKRPKEKNTDGHFEQFDTIEYGYRAAFIILRKYINVYGCNTIETIIKKWAPDGHTIEQNYIKRVETLTGIPRQDTINFDEEAKMIQIIRAMAAVENGKLVNIEPIERAYRMI